MTRKDKFYAVLVGVGLFGFFIYSIRSILLPFVAAFILAYFLNPAANKLQKFGLSRSGATSFITLSFFLISLLITALLAPVLYHQIAAFLHSIPNYITYVNDKIIPKFEMLVRQIDPEALEKAKDSLSSASSYSMQILSSLIANIFSSGIAALNILSLLLVTPIVTFYMLCDWHIILNKINMLLPKKYARTIRSLSKQIDSILAGYIRGQTQVCLIIGAYYAICLGLTGLQFSLFIGFATGLLLFVPYIGVFLGFALAILVAFFQFDNFQPMAIIAAIFAVGMVVEGVFITPNLVGNKVGLHPAWIMFGLLAGGAMFGFTGVLIALPLTAVIGVLTRFFVGEYLKKNNI